MMDTTVAMLNAGMNYIHAGMLGGWGTPSTFAYQPFKTADGFIVAIGNDTQFNGSAKPPVHGLCGLIPCKRAGAKQGSIIADTVRNF